ncbi:MAG: UDP-N-acetylmuramoyl-L-alanine--D-glutamate ligase [Candidatus Melainabacteria bacterium]|nr:UDP-N-acetylmuramoyl-L-alanine--D-glutamate ligase [Candidatus Melainabacteria bacterium]
MNKPENRNVTVFGLGRSGLASIRYLKRLGFDIFVSDAAPENKVPETVREELKKLSVECEFGGHTEKCLAKAKLCIVSPGMAPNLPIILTARERGIEVVSDIEFAFRRAEMSKIPIVAVTGTNGKSTTTALISHIFSQSGMNAPYCGNIGVPILEVLTEAEEGKKVDFLVAEVSSYQLEYCTDFAPKVGVWLNLTPDHLDWHQGLEPYIKAKQKLFYKQGMSSFAVLNYDDPIVISTTTMAEIFPFSQKTELENCIQGAYVSDNFICLRRNMQVHVLCRVDQLKIKGAHNVENALAAASCALLLGVDSKAIASALQSFTALEHRLEFIDTIDGIEFYNDSKATNTESTIKALEAFGDQKVVLIAGGKDKGTSLTDLAKRVRQCTSAVILIGEAAERFNLYFNQAGVQNIYRVATLDAAVKLALELKLGPVVLSPACASFDMFRDYEERGHVFKNIVRAKQKELASQAK